jgi:hypothetical protein
MRVSVRALALTAGLLGGSAVLWVSLANLIWPEDGRARLELSSSIYPGYHATQALGSAIAGTPYALLDGVCGGLVLGWFCNRFAG